jgi:hypothetical protein
MTALLVHARQVMPNVVERRCTREMTSGSLACKREMSAPFPARFCMNQPHHRRA